MIEENREFQRLNQIGRREPFQAPEGYFSGFNNRLRDRMTPGRKVKETAFLRPAFALGIACLLIAGFLVNSQLNENPRSSEAPQFTEAMETACLYGIEEEQVAEVYSGMFHEAPEQEIDDYMLQDMDETILISNL